MRSLCLVSISVLLLASAACDDEMPLRRVVYASQPPTTGDETPSKKTPDGSSDERSTRTDASSGARPGGPSTEPKTTEDHGRTASRADAGRDRATTGGEASDQLRGVVNLNTATVDDLMRLPGIGPALSKRIVDYRENRPFEEPDDLVRIDGIGEATYKRLRPWLAVTGRTRLEH